MGVVTDDGHLLTWGAGWEVGARVLPACEVFSLAFFHTFVYFSMFSVFDSSSR